MISRSFKSILATALSVLALPTFYKPTVAAKQTNNAQPTTRISKEKAVGIGLGALAGAAVIATGAVLLNLYSKYQHNAEISSTFESKGDGNTFRVDDDVKRNADPRILALILETFYDIFKKYPSLINYITGYNQYFAAANFQSPTIKERGLPVDNYHMKIKSFNQIHEDCLYAHATDSDRKQWDTSQISSVKSQLQNYFITTDLSRFSIYFNFNNVPKCDETTIKKSIAFAVGMYIYDMYARFHYTNGEYSCLLDSCQNNSALLIAEPDIGSNVLAPLTALGDASDSSGNSALQLERSHFGTIFMQSIYEENEIDQTYVNSLETIFKKDIPNLRGGFNDLGNQGIKQVDGDEKRFPKWWRTVLISPMPS